MNMLYPTNSRAKGFTVVELIIVTVVIAILASITVVGYQEVRENATTARRISDINSIVKALEIYKSKHGQYPASSDTFVKSTSSNFLSAIAPYMDNNVPIDPVNNSGNFYQYMRWEASDAGYNSCTRAMGKFYILEIITDKKDERLERHSPNFTCVREPYYQAYNNEYHSYITGSMETPQ